MKIEQVELPKRNKKEKVVKIKKVKPPKPVKVAKPKNYISNKLLLLEIIQSKKDDKLTYKAEQMFIILAERVVRKFRYNNPDDKKDCLQTAYLDMFANWRNFDPTRSQNAFAYFTEITKRGLARGWNILVKKKGDPDDIYQVISIEGSNEGDGLYSI